MPVYSCGGGCWRIGNGKCIYKSKKSAMAAYRGYLATHTEEDTVTEPKLTKVELRAMLDAKIRRSAGWKLRDNYNSIGVMVADEDAVGRAVSDVYDDIVADYAHSETTVKATRSVRFNKSYVARVIKAGLKDGSVKTEAMFARAVAGKALAVDEAEGCDDPGKKRRSKGKGRGLARGKGKGPMGVPYNASSAEEAFVERVFSAVEGVDDEGLDEKYVGFKKLVQKLRSKKKSPRDPEAVAAAIARKKYGKKRLQKAAASGKKMR